MKRCQTEKIPGFLFPFPLRTYIHINTTYFIDFYVRFFFLLLVSFFLTSSVRRGNKQEEDVMVFNNEAI